MVAFEFLAAGGTALEGHEREMVTGFLGGEKGGGGKGCTPEEWWEVKGWLFLSFPTAHNAVGYLHEDSY